MSDAERSTRVQVSADAKGSLVWETARSLAPKGQFEELMIVKRPGADQQLVDFAGHIDPRRTGSSSLTPAGGHCSTGTTAGPDPRFARCSGSAIARCSWTTPRA
jgi:hypothetical protein